ncbi:MAG: 30S ribosomal protein S17 [Phycisphaerae bacterium]|nr:30S ribosomal protein S17 [Phycisphaerae bacterium]
MANEQSGQSVARTARRRQVGMVVSDVRDKTVTVRLEYQAEHSRYGKQIRRRTRIQVHDEKNEAKIGDRVQVMECRPISKTKTWRLEKILASSPQAATV